MTKIKQDTPYINNDGILYTRNLLLRGIAGIYLCSFLTFYYQAPGLFGRNGILPAEQLYSTAKTVQPVSLVYYHHFLGLDVNYMLEFLSLLGVMISFVVFTSSRLCVMPVLTTLWALYYSVVMHMQIFENQSDNLLLEVGFACIILAPITDTRKSGPSDKIAMVLIKWILMRFLFDSGSVKFFSGCSSWWSFQGLKYHFETMPLPTSMAWWSHHLPTDFITLINIYANITELVSPWFFFFPSRAVRIVLFHWVLYLQLAIILTGNYGFLNFLTSTILLALLDDKYLKNRPIKRLVMHVFIFSILFTIVLYLAQELLLLKKLIFKYEHLGVLRSMARLAPLVAVVATVVTFLTNAITHQAITSAKGYLQKASYFNTVLAFTLCTLSLIGISVVPHNNMDASLNITNTQLGEYYNKVSKYHIVNEYGRHLRRMRTERVEINLEYADHLEGPWMTIPFLFKPWNENETSPYAGPYLPRLDVKFYDAAPMNYKDQLWMMPLIYRILKNEPDVLRLFGIQKKLNPAPRYIRGMLYHFTFTPFNSQKKSFWRKTIVREYFPTISLQDTRLFVHLQNLQYQLTSQSSQNSNKTFPNILYFLRRQLEKFEASKATSIIWFTGVAVNLIKFENNFI